MIKTVLITGATGSIGTKLRRHFSSQPSFDLRLLCLNKVSDPDVFTADLAEYDKAWTEMFEGVNVVVHLAGDPYSTASWTSVQRNNIDLTLNVFRAAEEYAVKRLVFASSNWVMAGYRFENKAQLTTSLPPWPINPYGCGKLFGERAGRDLSERTGMSFIALRIGYCQHVEGNVPGPHMENGVWGQRMWLSDRDLCHGVERAVVAENVSFAVLNLMSANPGMRWDIDTTRLTIGYQPQDGHIAVNAARLKKRTATSIRTQDSGRARSKSQ